LALLLLVTAFVAPRQATAVEPGTQPIDCDLETLDPRLFFDFRLHHFFRIDIPMKEARKLAGPLTLTMDVENVGGPAADPFHSETVLPLLGISEKKGGGTVEISGSFATGEGRYRSIVHLQDAAGKSCSFAWNPEAELDGKDRKKVRMRIRPGDIQNSEIDLFTNSRAYTNRTVADTRKLRLKLFVNVDRPTPKKVTSSPRNMVVLVSALREILRRPDVGEVALTLFSLEDQKVLHEQDFQRFIDFNQLGKDAEELEPGLVSLRELRRTEGEFFGEMLVEREGLIDEADATVFIGMRSIYRDDAPKQVINRFRNRGNDMFLIQSNPYFTNFRPFRDLVSEFVDDVDGKEYEVRLPRDLAESVTKILERVEPRPRPVRNDIASAQPNSASSVDEAMEYGQD
jgi:hypothetical protein